MKIPTTTSLTLAVLAGISLITPAFAAVTTDSFGSGANTFTMDFVTIGNPGNAADTGPVGYGAVASTYRMGRYEVSEDMIEKANAAGSLGITKDTRGTNVAATSVTWNEAARFVNYLNLSSGSVAAYKFTTSGVNDNIALWQSGDAGYNAGNPFRNSLAKYFLPSENEWYKAAYYSSAGTYFDYATGSDTVPTAVSGGTTTGTAVFNFQTNPANITNAGGLSPYGTMAQGGNVWEWTESESDGVNDSSTSSRSLRGGSFDYNVTDLVASYHLGIGPTAVFNDVGFRVASVIPEPTSLVLTLLASTVLLARRKR